MSQNYDTVSEKYRELTSTGVFQGQIKTEGMSGIDRLIEQLKKHYQQTDSVLEIACGTGRATFRAIKFAKNIVATDISKESIEEAKKISKSIGTNRVTFEVMDATKLKFKNDAFTLVFTHLPSVDLLKYFSEVKRVLKPYGLFIITHSGFHHMAETGKIHRMYYLQKTLRLAEKYGFLVIACYEDKQKVWFKSEIDRWNLVTMPYGNDQRITKMKKSVERFKDKIGYPLTLDKVTLVLKKN